MSMLEVKEIRKSFDGKTQVLNGIDVSVSKGEVIAILGPSGGGKTTLLRCINFLEKADSGSFSLDGKTYDFAKITRKEIAEIRRKTAFVFQNYNLFLNKTALQNVTEGLIVARKMEKAKAEEIGRAALEKVGMLERVDYYPNQLSGGQQQRVAIARALAAKPAILLADEPTGNLDSKTGMDVIALLKMTSQAFHQTIVMITHNEEIALMADRMVRIEDGKVVNGDAAK